uniref:Uncharacterized protein n=1 Tax=Anguilla anguilla TaxID=7936 RepID=A0A0E9WV40_ANGAN
MDAGIEKECSALGGLFQTIMNDMKVSQTPYLQFKPAPNLIFSLTLDGYLKKIIMQNN